MISYILVGILNIFVAEYCEVGSSKFRVDYELLQIKINKDRTSVSSVPLSKRLITQYLKRIDSRIRTIDVDKKAHPESCGKDYMYIKLKTKRTPILAELLKVKADRDAKKKKKFQKSKKTT